MWWFVNGRTVIHEEPGCGSGGNHGKAVGTGVDLEVGAGMELEDVGMDLPATGLASQGTGMDLKRTGMALLAALASGNSYCGTTGRPRQAGKSSYCAVLCCDVASESFRLSVWLLAPAGPPCAALVGKRRPGP